MKIICDMLTLNELKDMAIKIFGNMVKAVADVEQGLLAVDAELHSDLEALLLEQGSQQKDLWGINLYPQVTGEGFIEFDSMINVRPSQGNKSRSVQDPDLQKKIIAIVNKRIVR